MFYSKNKLKQNKDESTENGGGGGEILFYFAYESLEEFMEIIHIFPISPTCSV